MDISSSKRPATSGGLVAPRARAVLLLAAAAIAVAACGDKTPDAPTGQVVAILDGQEITVLEVNAELQGTPIPPNMTRRDAEKVALDNIITRRMLSKAAEERELTKKPDFLMQERRTAEQLRVQALARDIAAKVAPPTRDEANKFIDENPWMFRDRKFFILDQIQFLRPDNIQALGFEGAKTMGEIEAILNANKIEFRRQPASLDALSANPNFIREVSKVLEKNPQELFMFASRPQGAPAPVVLVNQVKESRVQPFMGDEARTYATNFLRNERTQAALRAEVEKQQKAAKEKTTFQAGWEPAAPKKADPKAFDGKDPNEPGLPAAPLPDMALPGGDDAAAGAPSAQPAPAATAPAGAAVAPAG
jgi:EpsD family peptidyl-prolyl cis-trans isomerase